MSYWYDSIRILGAAFTDTPIKVPVSAQFPGHVCKMAKISFDKVFTNPLTLIEISLLLTEYYGITVAEPQWDVYNIEPESIGQKIKYFPNHIPDIDRSDYVIQDKNDIDKIRFNGLYAGRFSKLVDSYKLAKDYTGLPRTGLVASSPFCTACNIYGYENLIASIASDPKFVHEMLRSICDNLMIPYIRDLKNQFPEAQNVILADAWASIPLINMKIMNNFVVPYVQYLNDNLKIPGFIAMSAGNWGDTYLKNPMDLVEARLKMTMNTCLLALDPDVNIIGPEFFKNVSDKHSIPLQIGFDASLLEKGPVSEIIARVKRYIKAGASGGKFILFLNNINADTPPEHVHAFIAAVNAYGKYPIPEHFDSVEVKIPKRESFESFVKMKINDNIEGYTFLWLKDSGLYKT
ncbi:MAG: uroporphyrinogen decarboxylase family protein [Pseudomonadota bacterium]